MINQLPHHDILLNYNPEAPDKRFIEAGHEHAILSHSERMPAQVPWPTGLTPIPVPLDPEPDEKDSLDRFKGYDAVVITWTAAEAATLAALFTPGCPTTGWYEYRHNVDAYIPLVTGVHAPFNDKGLARYYHSLALYFPCQIGDYKVLVMKSGLHLDYDGPATPVYKLIQEIIAAVQPKLFITTGTGGGIGADVALGDVVIGAHTRFDCTTQFKNESWASASYATSSLATGVLAAITPDLTSVNAAKIGGYYGARATPKIWSGGTTTIVTTDFFGFDDSTDHYKLQGKGQSCDMGDAMVIKAAMESPIQTDCFAVRNASDPQIKNPSGDMKEADKEAGYIYRRFGVYTTAASVIASWAIITNS